MSRPTGQPRPNLSGVKAFPYEGKALTPGKVGETVRASARGRRSGAVMPVRVNARILLREE